MTATEYFSPPACPGCGLAGHDHGFGCEVCAQDAEVLAEDAIRAEDEGPICWDEFADERTVYARNGSVS